MNPLIESKYTQVGDLNIHYLSAGAGKAILLLHGWPTSAYLWRNVMPPLAENHRVIAMDLSGFGKSDKRLEDSYSFRYHNRVISGFLENLGIDKITLGVHDLGGPLGLFWAVRNMERVDKLILLNTLVYPEFSWGVKLFGLATVTPLIRDWITSPAGIKWAIKFGVHQKEKLTAEVFQNYQEPFAEKHSRKILLKSIQRLSIKGYRQIAQKLPTFQGPVQIVFGEKDSILPKVKNTMERVKNDLPQAQIVSLPNCGHFIQEEEPERIGEILKAFLNQ